jgi:hypothetical protein
MNDTLIFWCLVSSERFNATALLTVGSVVGLVPESKSQVSPQREKYSGSEEWAVWPGGTASAGRWSRSG